MNSISQNERIHSIDIIRGIAIFGIFLVNWPVLAGVESRDLTSDYEGFDRYIRLFYDLFVQTKFYTIFSFLFGLGFYIFMERAEKKTPHPKLLFIRRLLILFLFGFLHYVLLWDGDILHDYAIGGFLLLLFYKRQPKTLLIWSLILLSVWELFVLFMNLIMLLIPHETPNAFSTPVVPLLDWSLQVQDRFTAFYSEAISSSLIMLPETVGLFLLGLYAGKKEMFRRVNEIDTKLKKWQIITFLSTLPTWGIIITYFTINDPYVPFTMIAFITLSGKTLFIFYIFTLMRLLQHAKWQKVFRPFQYVGRMALTNYISQTVVTLFVFGLLFKANIIFPLWGGTLFCIGFYIIQIFISRWWLSRYQYGPLEYIWRLGTYGKSMPLKKQSSISS
ncbi:MULTISPECIES: DUF418 domain-containing protein [unclassified Bacillus (in: firmicutes)]|uniref:DUF418 domain-containing protein n=1 Tax=unclassified Bacillus (in: firmicutes) TaxID=185979 RepID=UPI0008EF6A6D|nr:MULTISPECIES: DUF418 domain-containing protein [unclassified Bacillus (in: firmicutes)]SFI12006.1 uncharacterized protein SAMN04488574_101668 [Bacillus sp. 71mf]SFS75534.1 uncharacterized protein SAMN04488145_103109 [Bacillus sp. 103mf]